MQFVPLVALGSLVFVFVNFLKFVKASDWNAALTQIIAWAAGVGAVCLVAATQFGSQIAVNGTALDKLSFASQLVVGLLATSLLSTFNEAKKAVDGSDTAATPPLFPAMTKNKVAP